MGLESFFELSATLRPGFERAAIAHQEWRNAFELAIRGGDTDFRVETSHACAFGRWLENDGPLALANARAHQMLQDLHSEFHDAADRAFARVQSGRIRDAVELIQPESQYARWSDMLAAALKCYGIAETKAERASD